jgi:D-alanine-D-alanine ligase
LTEELPQGPLTVAVLAGGRSSEHAVSLSSAAAVRDGLLAGGHEVVWIEIGRDGIWRRDGERIAVTPGEGMPGIQVVFPALHGPFGEDGTVQGLLEMLDVAYVGAGVTASAVCMDKVLFKDLMSALEVPQVDYVGVRAARYRREPEAVHAEVDSCGWPVFVKPAHLGSSVGIVKVPGPDELPAAMAAAFEHDELVIIEAMAPGKEIECGVLGVLPDDADLRGPFASEPGEIAFAGEFYDYEAKYLTGGMELLVPARILTRARDEVMRLAARTFELVGCDGLARADFFVDGERVLLNELNTMPGFTPTSVYAKLLAASGVDYPQLVERLCRLALARHGERAGYRF